MNNPLFKRIGWINDEISLSRPKVWEQPHGLNMPSTGVSDSLFFKTTLIFLEFTEQI